MEKTMTMVLSPWKGFEHGRRRQYSMLPMRMDAKLPCLDRWKEFQTRLCTLEEAKLWQKLYPWANPCMVTGELTGIIVLDQDGEEAYKQLCSLGIPDTVTVSSPRGEYNRHYWFAYPKGLGYIHNFASGYKKEMPGIDLRGDGGIVGYPGAVHKPTGQSYQFVSGKAPEETEIVEIPEWLLEYIFRYNTERHRQHAESSALAEEVRKKREGLLNARFVTRLQKYARKAWDAETNKVRFAQKGSRNNQLLLSSAALARFIPEGIFTQAELESDLESAARACGLDKDSGGMSGIRATIRNGISMGMDDPVILSVGDLPEFSDLEYSRTTDLDPDFISITSTIKKAKGASPVLEDLFKDC